MGMDNRKTSGGSFVAALVFFVMTASIAIFLLLTALVVWLSEVTGSFILSVYDVARAAKEGYEWLTDKFLLFMKLREMRK